jgi:hypothetical protein
MSATGCATADRAREQRPGSERRAAGRGKGGTAGEVLVAHRDRVIGSELEAAREQTSARDLRQVVATGATRPRLAANSSVLNRLHRAAA